MATTPSSTVTSASRSDDDALEAVHSSGWLLVLAGAVSIVCGILALVYPDVTLLALAIITGINIVLFGIMGIVDAVVSDGQAGGRVLAGIVGVLGIVAGIVIIRRPGETLLVLILAVGLWLVIRGIVEAISALTERPDRGLRLLVALFDLVLGILILALPKVSLGTVAALVGIAFLLRGVFTVYLGIQARRVHAPQRTPDVQVA